jgi:hypothetical protein
MCGKRLTLMRIINLITDDIKPYVCADPFPVVHKYGVFLTVSFC